MIVSDYDIFNNRLRIGARISFLRRTRKMTQTDLAKISGLTQGNICRIERGAYGTTVDVLFKLTQALGADLDIVFC
jgi:transcriptional regulator with XRE-family HTH domain